MKLYTEWNPLFFFAAVPFARASVIIGIATENKCDFYDGTDMTFADELMTDSE